VALVLLLVALATFGISMWLMSGFDECFMCHDVPGDPCYDKGHTCL
jgi:hypothetical protein